MEAHVEEQMLINKSVDDLDSVRTRPMIEELVLKTGS
jgi:hypothetical protein